MKDKLCPACASKRLHTVADWEYHPEAGHGFNREQGWTLPYLNPLAPPQDQIWPVEVPLKKEER